MKIIVYNSSDQYAISRAEIGAIRNAMPSNYWARIRELHIAHSHPRQCEAFEFDEDAGVAYLIVPVVEKTPARRMMAVRSLLVGLARISSRSRFFLPLKARESMKYEEFVTIWEPRCVSAIRSLHEQRS